AGVRGLLFLSIAHRDREKRETLMKNQRSIITLAIGVTLALASTAQGQLAQGDRSLPTSKAFAVNHSTAQAQKAARLRAQHQAMLADFWRLPGPGSVA